ncbi:MAG: long-chain fatty acid--CoA ligase, partial [Spirochaetes bacterium]|nr:long-chain fatty acid--CoA ligase [Spirochaetota bacterium]
YVFPAALEEDIRLITYIENAMIYGDGRPYNICLIIPDFVVLKKFAEKHCLPADPKEMIKNQEIKTLIETEINNFLKNKYASYEIPKKYIYISETFTLENGMLTQTMKLKRRVVFDKYKDQIEALYKC